MEIYIPRKLKGYVSEFIILADMKDLCSDNFKRVITKRNIDDGLIYSTERQFKFIAFNVGSFSSTLWKMMRHFIPKRTLAKISILSSDKDEIYETLHELMDSSVIPEYLGGTNTRTYKDDLMDEIAYVGTKNEKQ